VKKPSSSETSLSSPTRVANETSPIINPVTLADQVWVEGQRQWIEKLRHDNDWVPIANNGYAISLSKKSEQERKEYWKKLLDDIPPISAIPFLKDDPAFIAILENKLANALDDGKASRPMKDVTQSGIGLPRPAKVLGQTKTKSDKN
jgi:hypothetical protein